MFVTVVCVIFLIKFRWPETNSIYDLLDLFKTWRSQRFQNILIRRTGWKVFFTALQVLFYHRVTWGLCSPGSFFNKYYTLHYIALHYITLHCIALHYITLHCNALHCIAVHYITLHYSNVCLQNTCIIKSAVELHSKTHTHAVHNENNYPLHFVSVAYSALTNEPLLLLLSLGSFPVISRSSIDIHERSAGESEGWWEGAKRGDHW